MALDGSGRELASAKALGTDYFARGCIVPASGADGVHQHETSINRNAFYDTVRRFSQCIRIVNRLQFAGYAVQDGRSILWFRRHSVQSTDDLDLFSGIADQIVHEAPRHGWTNEWLLGVSLKPYHSSGTSLWNPIEFSDYWSWFDRCLFYDPSVANDADWCWHIAYGQATTQGNLLAESPSGYRYGRLTDSVYYLNQKECSDAACVALRRRFFQSCRLYEPDIEIDTAEAVTEDGVELVKITLMGRLHNTHGEDDGAPESIDRDTTTWSSATISAEPFRTIENALRWYLIHADDGTNPAAGIGDNSLNSGIQLSPDNPWASIYPHFHFTRLIPLPYDDGNEGQDKHDTPLWHDVWPMMELYLRSMCEGFVDPLSTLELSDCAWTDPDPTTFSEIGEECTAGTSDLYDYTFESLCYAAFGGRWMGTLPTVATPRIGTSNIRDDLPQGFGPLPNTEASAELFNQFAAAVDILTHVRLMVPWRMMERTTIYSDATPIPDDPAAVCGSTTCGASGLRAYYGEGPAATTINTPTTDWTEATGLVQAFTEAGFSYDCYGGFVNWNLVTTRYTLEYDFSLVDEDMWYAFHPSWAEMWSAGGVGTLACVQDLEYHWLMTDSLVATPCGAHPLPCSFTMALTNTGGCEFLQRGSVDFGPLAPESWFYVVKYPPSDLCKNGSDRHRYITPLFQRSLFLSIPVYDPDEEGVGA